MFRRNDHTSDTSREVWQFGNVWHLRLGSPVPSPFPQSLKDLRNSAGSFGPNTLAGSDLELGTISVVKGRPKTDTRPGKR